jgi:large repetitive protein
MLSITSPMAGQQVGSPVTITGNAEPGATISILIDGVVVGSATADANGAWSFEAGELGNGTHTVEATSTDAGGNMGSSGSVSFEVKAGAMVTITAPSMGGTVTGPSVTVTGTGEPGTTLTVTVGEQTKTVVVGEDGSWSVTFEDVPAGPISITADDGSSSVSIDVTVNDPTAIDGGMILSGAGGCAQGAGGSPVSGGLWLLVMGAMALGRRRRRA